MAYNSYGEPHITVLIKEEEITQLPLEASSHCSEEEHDEEHDEENCELCRLEQDQPDTCSTLCWAMSLPVAIVSIYLGMVYTL